MRGYWQRCSAKAMLETQTNVDDVDLLRQLIAHGGKQAFSLVPLALKKVIEEKQWQNHRDKKGTPFTSFEAFATHAPWEGLGTSIEDLRAFCRKTPDVEKLILQEIQPARESRGSTKDERASRSDNVTPISRGNSALYTLKRLRRDRPDLFDQVLAGVTSANAAAIEAGFRKKRRCPNCGHEL